MQHFLYSLPNVYRVYPVTYSTGSDPGAQAAGGRRQAPRGGVFDGEAARLTLPTKEKSKKSKKCVKPLDILLAMWYNRSMKGIRRGERSGQPLLRKSTGADSTQSKIDRCEGENQTMKIGYVRVSTAEQNTVRQENLMKELGVEKIFIDKASGKNTDRPELEKMLSFIREGDVVVVSEISRFARNTRDLLDLVDRLTKKGVQFESQKEKIDTNSPAGKFMLTVFAAIGQLERDYILERQAEGIAAAKERGVYKGKKAIDIDEKAFEQEYRLWKKGEITAVAAMGHLGLKPNTFYRRVKDYEANGTIAQA